MSTVNGQTTTFAYDAANQLVSKTLPDGTVVTFGYDAAGRLVREGDRRYAYGWLDKVLAVTGADGETLAAYAYGLDNQLASATVGGATEEFLWDGLALVRRGAAGYLNEPHANGGSPLLSSDGELLFNDLLGSTLGTFGGDGYRPVSLTAFGDTEEPSAGAFFTGKPLVDGLGYAFLLRNYRPDHGKWLTADPLGYPDGWNQMAYCNNWVTRCIDVVGTFSFGITYSFSFAVIGGPNVSGAIGYNSSSGSVFLSSAVGGGIGYDCSFSVQGFYSSGDQTMGEASYYDATASCFMVTGTVVTDTSTYNTTYAAGVTISSTLVPVTPVGGHVGGGGSVTSELFNLSDFLYDIFYKVDENLDDFDTIVEDSLIEAVGGDFTWER